MLHMYGSRMRWKLTSWLCATLCAVRYVHAVKRVTDHFKVCMHLPCSSYNCITAISNKELSDRLISPMHVRIPTLNSSDRWEERTNI